MFYFSADGGLLKSSKATRFKLFCDCMYFVIGMTVKNNVKSKLSRKCVTETLT